MRGGEGRRERGISCSALTDEIMSSIPNATLTIGGASLGFYHVGVARALLNEGLLPRVIR